MYIFNEDNNNIEKVIKEYVAECVEPGSNKRNSTKEMDEEFYKKIGQDGYMGMIIPEKYSGNELDLVSSTIILDNMSQSDASLGHILSATNYTFCYPLYIFGTEEQKEKYLKPCAEGKSFASLCCSEATIECKTSFETLEDNKYKINGIKSFVTAGKIADYALIMATNIENRNAITFFIVDVKNTPGVIVGKEEESMGLNNIGLVDLTLNDVIVTSENVLGEVDQGMKVMMGFANLMKLGNSTIALGIAKRAYKEARDYMKVRKIGEKPLIELQAVKHKLAEMKADLEIMNLTTYTVANNIQNNKGFLPEQTTILKLSVTEKAKEICDKALQMFGGYGYMKGNVIERLYRDVRVMTIIGGHSDSVKDILSKFI